MFFVISKILSFLISPESWILVLLILSVVVKKEKLKKRFLISTLAVFFFFSNGFIVAEFMRLWEVKHVSESSLKTNYDVVLVMGGGMMSSDVENGTTSFRHNTDRVFQAVRLYKEHKADKILISGGSGSLHYRNMLEAVLLKDYFVEIGIPQNDIWIDSLSDNTYQNAVNCAKILEDSVPNGKYLLVSSASHIARTKACFEKQNVKCDLYPVDYNSGPRLWTFSNLLLPNSNSFLEWAELFHELVGFVVYYLYGYL